MFFRAISILLILSVGRFAAADEAPLYQWIEAEAASQMEWPIEIVPDQTASGAKALLIREGAGVGFRGAPGEAIYHLKLHKTGDYILWFRAKWMDGCGNSFYFSIDNHDYPINGEDLTRTIGHELTFDHWLWTRTEKIHLETGDHILKIKNREDGITLDKILLTDDLDVSPQGLHRLSYSLDHLSENSFIKTGDSFQYQNFNAQLEILAQKASYTFVYQFSYTDEKHYNEIKLKSDRLSLSTVKDGKPEEIASVSLDASAVDTVVPVDIYFSQGQLSVDINNRTALFVPQIPKQNGLTGFQLQDVTLQKAHVLPVSPIFHHDNFYDAVWNFPTQPLGWDEVLMPDKWYAPANEGFAYSYENNQEDADEAIALTVTGEKWWRNYQYSVYAKNSPNHGFALIFYYQNTENYYFLRYKNKTFELGLKLNNIDKVLMTQPAEDYDPAIWHQYIIHTLNGKIQIRVDGNTLLKASDINFSSGQAGFAAFGSGNIFFDDLTIESVTDEAEIKIQKIPYHEVKILDDILDFYPPETKPAEDKILQQVSKHLFKNKLRPVNELESPLQHWISAGGQWLIKNHALFCKERKGISQLWCKQSFLNDFRMDFDFALNNPLNMLGILLYQDDEDLANSITLSNEKITLFAANQKSKSLPYIIAAGQTHHASLIVERNTAALFIDGKKSGSFAFDQKPYRLRPSFWTETGNILIDNIEIMTKPRVGYDFSVVKDALEDYYDWSSESLDWTISFSDFFKGLRGSIDTQHTQNGIILWNKHKFDKEPLSIALRTNIYVMGKETDQPFDYSRSIIFNSNGSRESGYKAMVTLNKITLYRNNREVAWAQVKTIHRLDWNWIKIKKAGTLIRIYITDAFGHDRLGLEYTDENPLSGHKIGLALNGPEYLQVVFSPIYITSEHKD